MWLHTAEALLTCARPQVYSTATHGFPEFDVIAAGANGKPVRENKSLLKKNDWRRHDEQKNLKPYQRGDPEQERGGYGMLQS